MSRILNDGYNATKKEKKVAYTNRRQSILPKTLLVSIKKKSGFSSSIQLHEKETPKQKPMKVRKLSQGSLFLSCSKYMKLQKQICAENSKFNLYDQYKAHTTDMKKRLYTKSEKNDVLTILDYDKSFFSIVDQPTASFVLPYKSLVPIFNKTFPMRQEIGYYKDCILRIEKSYEKENLAYAKALKECELQKIYFEKFIAEDYHKSMEILHEYELLQRKIEEQDEALKTVIEEKFSVMANLILLEYKYRVQERYGRFLYYLAPKYWRAEHKGFSHSDEIQAKGFDFGMSDHTDTFSVVLDNLMHDCYTNKVSPIMYFKEPAELVDALHGIQAQQTHHFTHILKIVLTDSEFIEGVVFNFKKQVIHETKTIADEVKAVQDIVNFYEARCEQLQQIFMHILNGSFYEIVASIDSQKLMANLEYAFEKVVGSKPITVDIVTLASTLEKRYMTYCERMEGFGHYNLMAEAARGCRLEELKLKKARIAARELKAFNRLEKRLLNVMVVPEKGKVTTAAWLKLRQSRKSIARFVKNDKKTKELSDSEYEYLVNFTDWVPHTDPEEYLKNIKEKK